MNRIAVTLLLMILATVTPRVAFAEKAVCLVCKVKEGATKPEKAEAFRMHEGVRYAFCSDKCAKEFDTDAVAFLPPKFPRPAPEMALSDLGGKALRPSLEGKVVLVDFWATWCAPCQKSMPELQSLHEKYSDRGFSVVGVSVDERAATSSDDGLDAKIKKFVTKKKITYPIAIDSKRSPLWEQYRVKAVPAAFLIDRKGRIVAQWTGVPPRASEVEKELVAVLGRSG
jgi:thiol-disulfide isomerase/thioredoxin